LEQALALPIRHLSCYSIIPEEGTPFYQTGYEPDDDLSADMWDFAGEFLADHNMPRYEISNYALPPYRAKHNWNVWHGESYLGLGPSAASFNGIDRWTEVPSLEQWLAGVPPEVDHIERKIRLREIFLMGLRTVEGWEKKAFRETTGAEADFPELKPLLTRGWLVEQDGRIRPTKAGLTYWNEIGVELLDISI
jgi:oxygen-independent coproporphyrinogen-3 oxidase